MTCPAAPRSLSFLALQLLPAHTYTLLCDLKIITTVGLSWLALDRRVNRQAVASLAALLTGICIGQAATMTAGDGDHRRDGAPAALAAARFARPQLAGLLVMLLIALLSAVASVYTEWLMCHSRYQHESLHRQNIRLYSVGVVLNGLLFAVQHHGSAGSAGAPVFADMRASHWVVVLLLAFMGLVTVRVCTRLCWRLSVSVFVCACHSESMCRGGGGGCQEAAVTTVATAVVPEAASMPLRPEAPACRVSCCLTSLRCARSAAAQALLIKCWGNIIKVYASSVASLVAAGISHSVLLDPPPPLFFVGVAIAMCATLQFQKARQQHVLANDAAAACPGLLRYHKRGCQLVAGTIAFLGLVAWHVLAPEGSSLAALAVPVALPGARVNMLAGPKTRACMPVLPPMEPVCFVPPESRSSLGCPTLHCSLAAKCTPADRTCCAFLNLQMLVFLEQYLTSKGLGNELTLVYGTALGAMREHRVLPWTTDVDVALTTKAVLFLDRNTTRRELWAHGYAAWAHTWNRRLCPHAGHPSPDFQAAMQEPGQVPPQGMSTSLFVDIWSMWPAPPGTTNCSTPGVFQGLDYEGPRAAGSDADATMPQQFCVAWEATPLLLRPGSRQGSVDGFNFTVPDNALE